MTGPAQAAGVWAARAGVGPGPGPGLGPAPEAQAQRHWPGPGSASVTHSVSHSGWLGVNSPLLTSLIHMLSCMPLLLGASAYILAGMTDKPCLCRRRA